MFLCSADRLFASLLTTPLHTTATHHHNTSPAPLGFTMSLGNYETVVQQGSAVSLQCSVNSSDAQVQWLKDMQPVGSGNFYNISNVQKSNSGMYQCLVQPPNSSQSALVSSTYLNVYCECLRLCPANRRYLPPLPQPCLNHSLCIHQESTLSSVMSLSSFSFSITLLFSPSPLTFPPLSSLHPPHSFQ